MGADVVLHHPTWRASRLEMAGLTLAASRKVRGIPTGDVAHLHLAARGSFLREGGLMLLARARGVATVATLHGSHFVQFAHNRPSLVSQVLRGADVITCLHSEGLNIARASAPQARVELVPNPVALDPHSTRADQTDELVLFAGEIGTRKGAHVLWEAWPRVLESRPRAQCIMVGPLNGLTVPVMDGLEVRPPVDQATVRALLRSARVVALPSRAEGMPMILTEAMSAGRPFVSTPVGGIPELARGNGVLVPLDDAVALADALIAILADPERARSMGERGRSFCAATRSVEVIDDALRELYLDAQARATSRGT